MQINTVIFDWDGTLAQTLKVWLDTFRQVFCDFTELKKHTVVSGVFAEWSKFPYNLVRS